MSNVNDVLNYYGNDLLDFCPDRNVDRCGDVWYEGYFGNEFVYIRFEDRNGPDNVRFGDVCYRDDVVIEIGEQYEENVIYRNGHWSCEW